jgi:AraC-like DNA-binding protein
MAALKNPDHFENRKMEDLRQQLVGKVASHIQTEGDNATAIPGLRLYRRDAPTACMSAAYDPKLIFFVQGEKHINLGGNMLVCGGFNYLLTSVDLPVLSQVVKATPEEPMYGILLNLQMPMVREILSQEEFQIPEAVAGARGMNVGKSTAEMFDACLRLLNLLDSPRDIPFLGNLIQRELIYRILREPQGMHLRSIATLGEQCNRTARAVAWLRENFSKPLRVEDLAEVAQMGVSTLHHHFRSLTAMSPLQYQKQLRLHTARIRMLTDGLDAASAAFEVGYESPSQFSREYSRFFGQPPMRDVKARRTANESLLQA